MALMLQIIPIKKKYGKALREQLNSRYEFATGAYDLFVVCIEQGLRLCRPNGYLSFINRNKYLSAKYILGIRTWLLKHASLRALLDVSAVRVVEEASVYPVVSLFCKNNRASAIVSVSLPASRNLER